MKRRIIILSVLVLSLFTFTQSNSEASSYSCWECAANGEACIRGCDDEYATFPSPNPRWLMQCYDFCRWQEETCNWNC